MVQVKRHLAKTITYRIAGTLLTFGIIASTTRDFRLGAFVSGAELGLKPLLYFIHERVWYRYIKFGLADDRSSYGQPK